MKKKTTITAIIVLTVLVLAGVLYARSVQKQEEAGEDAVMLSDISIEHDTEFGAVTLKMDVDDFDAAGFSYGDSVDISFSNGYSLNDVPYYNGYYSLIGTPCLVGHEGKDHLDAANTYGDPLWDQAGITEEDTVTVTLKEAGAYSDVQEAMSVSYSDDRDDFESDEAFSNFRSVKAEKIKADTLFRSATPISNRHKRAHITDSLTSAAGIGFILDLADSDEDIKEYLAGEDFDSPYFESLYKRGRVYPVGVSVNYTSDEFRDKLIKGLKVMGESDGPYLVCCTEGKDRTGFVCLLLESLSGASYDEMVEDYMATYDNYYHINKESDPGKNEVIKEHNLKPMMEFLSGSDGSDDLTKVDFATCAAEYLKDGGMSDEELSTLIGRLTEQKDKDSAAS